MGDEYDKERDVNKKKNESKHKRSSKSHKDRKTENNISDETFSRKNELQATSSAKNLSRIEPIEASKPWVNLWELAIKEAQIKISKQELDFEERSILVIGAKSSGKTTLINRLLDKDEEPKPSIALEYIFARKAKSNNMDKEVGHIWEIGGGLRLSNLSEFALIAANFHQFAIVLTVDLSNPSEMWINIEKWLSTLQSIIERMAEESGKLDRLRILKDSAKNRYKGNHEDYDVKPFLLPLVIIATKFDILMDEDSDKRKSIGKTLRFLAHRYGAHLQFCSKLKNDSTMSRVRAILNNLLFASPLSSVRQTDYNKPLSVLVGQDNFQDIGQAPSEAESYGRFSDRNSLEAWKEFFTKHFPQEKISNQSLIEDPGSDPQFTESAIDALRTQKDEEYKKYKRDSGRRGKEDLQQMDFMQELLKCNG